MSTIINKSGFKIIKKEEGLYEIEYNKENELIISSLNIQKQIVSKEDKIDKVSLEIRTNSIESYPQLLSRHSNVLSYDICEALLKDIGTQCILLEDKGFVYADLEVSNIITFNNGEKFIYLDEKIFEKNSKVTFILEKPIEKTNFSSPELLAISKIPSQVYSKSWVYCLGAIVFFSLTKEIGTQRLREEEIKLKLQAIQDTKLYFCLNRMLYHNHRMRVFLFV